MKTFGKVILGLSAALVTMMVSTAAFAQNVPEAAAFNERDKWIAVSAGMGLALAAFGGAIAQGRTASTALDGIARNPGASNKLFVPMLLGLALIESLVIYSLIIGFSLLAKIK
jgi:F-type H+-transporting ATPase subunit c